MEQIKIWVSQPSAGIFFVLVALVVFFQLANPIFLTPVNIATMFRALAYPGIIAIGMALCLISGIIDLSVGSTAALSSVLFGYSLTRLDLSILPAIGIALFASVLIGIFNSFMILKLKIIPFIATISTMFIIRGIANFISSGYQIYPLPDGILAIGSARPFGVSWAFVVFVVIGIVAEIILQFSLLGWLFRAVGSDREIARCTEVNVNQINTIGLISISVLAAISGILISCMMNSGSPTVGSGWEFTAITACAIGGISLFGFHGSIFGLFCGMAVIQVVQNGIVMLGVSPYLQIVVVGLILLMAMYFDIKRRSYLDLDVI